MAKQKMNEVNTASKVEAVLLIDSNLGKVGSVIILSDFDAKTYASYGYIDSHPEAVKYAKSQQPT